MDLIVTFAESQLVRQTPEVVRKYQAATIRFKKKLGRHIRLASSLFQFGEVGPGIFPETEAHATRMTTPARHPVGIGQDRGGIPYGAGRILASCNHLNGRTKLNVDMTQYAVGYTHSLSKRTTLFTSYGHIDRNHANRMDLGIRHMF